MNLSTLQAVKVAVECINYFILFSAMNISTNEATMRMASEIWKPKYFENSNHVNSCNKRRRISFTGIVLEHLY